MKTSILLQIALFALSGGLGWYVCHASKDFQVRSPYTISLKSVEKVDDVAAVLIVGSGPAGMMAAVYAARANMPTVVLEGNKPGGELTQTSYIENWPGFERILGTEVIQRTKQQAQHFGAVFVHDSMEHIDASSWPFKVHTQNGRTISALTVIIATGSVPNILHVAGEEEYWGKGVTTCAVCDAPFHKDKDVVVVGGGDSAIEEAMQLSVYAKTVTILVRKDEMRAAASMQDRLTPLENVSVMYNTQVHEIQGDGNEVTHVVLENVKTGETFTKPVSGVFLAIGHTPNTKALQGVIELDSQGYIQLACHSQQTSLRGIFAAGDVADKHYKQASTALGDGVKAALEAVAFLQEHDVNTPTLASLKKRLFTPEQRKKFEVEKITTLERLETVIQNATGPVFVDFYATYCPSCMMMLPAVATVAYDMQGKATIVKVDAGESPDIAEKYHVGSLPAIVVFKGGSTEEVARYNKAMTEKELQEYVNKFLE